MPGKKKQDGRSGARSGAKAPRGRRAAAKRAPLVPMAGPKPQMQKRSGRHWTKAKEEQFLSVLSETCNVMRAAEAVGMSGRGAYKRRSKNAAFRAAWLETLSAAYQRLELVLLDRAFNGTERVTQRRDGSEERMREFPNGLGLSLLKMHRGTVIEASQEMAAEDVEELRERLMRKLQRLKQREQREAAPDE